MENSSPQAAHHALENPSFVEDEDEDEDVFEDEKGAQGVAGPHDDDLAKPKMTRRKMAVVLCILLTEMCERLTYYSVLANLVLFGTSVLKFSSTGSANVANIFTGQFVPGPGQVTDLNITG